ncbi:eukaryotic mitochondrial regulator protein-domain-containing protein [Exophiala viscosa]|uniref:eukaryotic mitochondrial regulator protein-domain-containing protein n=1 Tax=Exophiala viscosa TaxID=2486360 RepID=UPI00219C3A87|nr:eukaryotic mitochondrial regulator protein-domain-containing protein [Exophiala viscosa]
MPPRLPPSAASIAVPTPSIHTHCKSCLRRAFSSTPASKTRLRAAMFAWLQGPGAVFQKPLAGSTNYLSAYDRRGNLLRSRREAPPPSTPNPDFDGQETGDMAALEAAAENTKLPRESEDDLRPFPQNQHFRSQSILSEELQQEIWRRVQVEQKSVRQVSVEMRVDMRRVAAVVRLIEVENRMLAEGNELALPYARAVHSMVPVNQMDLQTGRPMDTHETINDLEQHPLTYPQVFYPTSESRAFNRTDAGRVFSGAPRLPDELDVGQGGKPASEPWKDTKPEYVGKAGHSHPILKPADSRIPHPQLIAFEKDKRDPELVDNGHELRARNQSRLDADARKRKEAKETKARLEEESKTRVDTGRWQFIFTDVAATREGTRLDGRGTRSPGFRYGVPSQERKKGQVKIPTRVEV